MYLEDLGSNHDGAQGLFVSNLQLDVIANTTSPLMGFRCSDSFTKGDMNTEWNHLSAVNMYNGDKADAPLAWNVNAAKEVGREMVYFGNSACVTVKAL